MKIYIEDLNRDGDIYLYGIDGDDHTEEYICHYFFGEMNNVMRFLSDGERIVYETTAYYAVDSVEIYDSVVHTVNMLQKIIDYISDFAVRNSVSVKEMFEIGEQEKMPISFLV